MRYLRFGRTNEQVSAISLGTWGHGGPRVAGEASVGWSGNDDTLATEALVSSYFRGMNHWDTADVYGDGHAEQLIGGVWDRVPREKIFLATKVGYDPENFGRFYHPDLIRSHMDRSLSLMKTDHVDLHYFHHCDFGPDDQYLDEALETMRRLRDEGKTRFIGLSDWSNANVMRVIERVDPDVVQPYRNVQDDDYEASGLRGWIDSHDLGVAFFSPLKHGLLLGKYSEPTQFPEGDYRRNVPGFGDAAALEKIRNATQQIRERFGEHPEPVLYALTGALFADAPTGCVLLGQRNRKQVDAASRIGEALSPEDAEWVKGLYR